MKRNLRISFKENGEWKNGQVVSRAGKVASKKGKGKEGVYEHHWKIRDAESGDINVHDTKTFEEIELERETEEEVDQAEDSVYAVNIPWNRQRERK